MLRDYRAQLKGLKAGAKEERRGDPGPPGGAENVDPGGGSGGRSGGSVFVLLCVARGC